MENVVISACLLGVACRYDGGWREYDLKNLKEKYNLIPVCPEIYGGLPTPRIPGEIAGDRVVNRDGVDVTGQYEKGARETLHIARLFGAKYALLKAKSPSCGSGKVYDGTFSSVLVDGDGITARLLKEYGIEIFNENEIDDLLGK